jgi:Cu(I)/Ag(I) efflux system membrane fusion protein
MSIRFGPPVEPSDNRQPPAHGFWWKTWQVLKVVQARLRFIAILAAVGVVLAYWDTLSNHYDRWTRPVRGAEATADPNVEYFCPMHPFIVRDDHKEKCPICHMDLARRKKGAGEAEPLAPGTVSRVQLTPYRIVLAGAKTSPVEYLPLTRQVTTFGSIEFNETTEAHIAARQTGRIAELLVNYTDQHVDRDQKLAVLDVRYDKDLMATLDDLRRARRTGDEKDERMARQALRRWDLDDKQIAELLRPGSTEVTITSPIEGHVIKVYQRKGSLVSEGTPLYDVADVSTVWVLAQLYEADQALLHVGMPVRATTLSLPGEVFTGTVDFIHPHLDEASRTLAVRFHIPNKGHRLRPGGYATVQVEVPAHSVGALMRPPAEDTAMLTALGAVTAPGGFSPNVAALLYSAGRNAPLMAGKVPAVPDSAVIDTGSLKVVYREAAPGEFEGVAVDLGPRMQAPGEQTAYYPVLRGLEVGERVVTSGAFLIDAETRLNPAAGSIYFGGSGGKGAASNVAVRPSTPEDIGTLERKARINLAKLDPADRRAAEAQKYCPIRQKTLLGSMGIPFKTTVDGQAVFLCCESCEENATKGPRKTLATVEALKKARTAAPKTVETPKPAPGAGKEAEIRANLAKLGDADRKLAEAQKYCPETEARLGDPEMGVPVKVLVAEQPVFVCCKACRKDAIDGGKETLKKVEALKARAKAEAHPHD